MKPLRLWPGLALLSAACSTFTHNAPVQERSPVLSRETTPPVLTRPGQSQGNPGSTPGQAAGSTRVPPAPPPPRPPSTSAIAGLAPPLATGNGDDAVAVATPLRPEGGASAGKPGATAPAAAAAAARPPAAAGTPAALPALEWAWPVDTPIVQSYSDASKGVDFTGAAGQPVRAAAAGTVSYVGNSLRGYGLMVVLKHDKGYLSVYAHNRQVLVKEGQKVERGQRIAEMGNSDSKDVTLHFELRHQGRPLDPVQTLPGR